MNNYYYKYIKYKSKYLITKSSYRFTVVNNCFKNSMDNKQIGGSITCLTTNQNQNITLSRNNYSITIIINSYQPKEDELHRSIESCLNQIGVMIYIIVVTLEEDPSIKIINSMNNDKIQLIIVKKSEHPGKGPKGIYYQLNQGLSHVKTRFVSYFSSNDEMLPNKSIDEITGIITNDAIFCFSKYMLVFESYQSEFYHDDFSHNGLLMVNFVNDCATIDLEKLNYDLISNGFT